MPFTLKQAGMLQPRVLRNEIVTHFDQAGRRSGGGVVSTADVFPLRGLDASTETYLQRHGGVGPMRPTALDSESPIVDMEAMSEESVTTHPYKAKLSPEKGVNDELNTPNQIANVFDWAVEELQMRLALTRDQISWRGDQYIDGLIGWNGMSAHPDLHTEHVITPDTPYSDTDGSTPQSDFSFGQLLIEEDGSNLPASGVRAFASPWVIHDLKQNDDLRSRFTGVEVQGLSESQVNNIIDIQLERVRMQMFRTNAQGEFIDQNDNVVDAPSKAARDNILEPYDPETGEKHRNIVLAAPGLGSASIPFYVDKLAEMVSNAEPSGDFAVDRQNGFITQVWTDHDPAISWFKVAQSIGFELTRPNNFVVIQDI